MCCRSRYTHVIHYKLFQLVANLDSCDQAVCTNNVDNCLAYGLVISKNAVIKSDWLSNKSEHS